MRSKYSSAAKTFRRLSKCLKAIVSALWIHKMNQDRCIEMGNRIYHFPMSLDVSQPFEAKLPYYFESLTLFVLLNLED